MVMMKGFGGGGDGGYDTSQPTTWTNGVPSPYQGAFGGEPENQSSPWGDGILGGGLTGGFNGSFAGLFGGNRTAEDRRAARQAARAGRRKGFGNDGVTGPAPESFSTENANFQTPRQPRAEFPDMAAYQHPQSQPMQINQDIMAAIMGPQPGPMQPGGPTQPMQSASSVHQLIGGNGQPPTPNLIGGAGPVGTIPNFNGTS